MSATDLVFILSPLTTQPLELVFGETEQVTTPVDVTITATLPALTVSIAVSPSVNVTLTATLPALTFVASVESDNDVPLYVGMRDHATWQQATEAQQHHLVGSWREAGALRNALQSAWQDGAALRQLIDVPLTQASKMSAPGQRTPWQQAQGLSAVIGVPLEQAASIRGSAESRWRDAVAQYIERTTPWHQGTASAVARRSVWRQATRVLGDKQLPWHDGVLNLGRDGLPWRDGNRLASYGNRQRPTTPVVPPELCYYPPLGSAVNLVFVDLPGDTNLLFVCERTIVVPPTPTETVVVPVRKVYMVLNNVTLRRVAGDLQLPSLSMSLNIDADSWTWGFSANLPAQELANVQPDSDGTPVELEATINGVAYRLLAEKIGRDRSFGVSTIKVSGRGKNAILDAPYAIAQSFANSAARTAQQLMNDALTVGGVSIGWDVAFGIEDWLVPGGAWNHQGTYISAVSTIAAAAGGYLQPHRTANTLRVLPRYPSGPWDWGTVTPDFELPADLAVQEGIEWIEKARYNRVFVSGTAVGVLGQVTRTGTAGDIVAPLVTDALNTSEVVARQRGLAVLSDTGPQALVSLRLPVLAETGVIEPGKFVSYVDGATVRLGIVRSTSINASFPEVWQTIGVETHG